MLDVETAKEAEVAPPGTVTEAGAVTPVPVFAIATNMPPAGAAALVATVHIVDAPAVRFEGVQASEDSCGLTVALVIARAADLLTEFAVAVTVKVCTGVEAVVATLNRTVVALAGTVTDAGAVTPVPVLVIATTIPLAGAAALIPTVHVEAVPAVKLEGAQTSDESAGNAGDDAVPAIVNVALLLSAP